MIVDVSNKYVYASEGITAVYWETGLRPIPYFCNLVKGQGCKECDNPQGGPFHIGSPTCHSGGLGAFAGYRAHCSCDACY